MKIKDVLNEGEMFDALKNKLKGRVSEEKRVRRVAHMYMKQAINLVDISENVEGEGKLREILKQIKEELIEGKKTMEKKPK